MVKALLIDDDPELTKAARAALNKYRIILEAVSSTDAGFRALEKGRCDVILLDITLAQINGLQMCRTIRHSSANYRDLPLIMLTTARTDLADILTGLDSGADDYIRKPFEPHELVARINAVLRHFSPPNVVPQKTAESIAALPQKPAPQKPASQKSGQRQLILDGNILTIDLSNAQLLINRTRLSTNSVEFELVKAMSLSPGDLYSRSELLEKVRGAEGVSLSSIDALIYRLRSKIEQAGINANFIRTVGGRGYALIGAPLP